MSLLQFAIAFDQLINTVVGGMADETISARAHRKSVKSKRWAFMKCAIDTIFFWQKDHCYQSFVSELHRKQMPSEYRVDVPQ